MTTRNTQRLLGLALALAWPSAGLHAADWPSYRHDNQRSAITAEALKLPLAKRWQMTPAQPPSPAWAKPAKFDFYVSPQSRKPLVHRLAYDHAYHATAAGDRVYYGSSAEHTVNCLDAYSGKEKWVFFTDGPVRFAPSIHDRRVYAGSDDGTAYCLDAVTGRLIWSHTAASEKNKLVPNDGRLVSPWSVRSSVSVDAGTAYFTSGFFPHEGVYMSAVDALTGNPTQNRHWKQYHLNKGSFQGYMLLSNSRIYMPGGRSTPFYFDRLTGRQLGHFAKGSGMGSFALLADNRIVHGPADRSGGVLTEASLSGDKLASHTDALDMIVDSAAIFMLTANKVTAMTRSYRRAIWNQSVEAGNALALAGKTLFVGSNDKVSAFNAADGKALWSGPVPGRALGLAVAN
jgi:outer membrane protein assembly factor BamB